MTSERKPTFDSVTTERCRCDYLAKQAEDPTVPIDFDPKMHEYNIVGSGGSTSLIYHCPWCGGVAPPSKRPNYFAIVTEEELSRLRDITRDLSTLDDAITRFGPPAEDRNDGVRITTPGAGTQPPVMRSHRTLKFPDLSETVDVLIEDHGAHGVRAAFLPKYVGEPEAGGV